MGKTTDPDDPYAPWWAGLKRGDESPETYAAIGEELGVSPRTVAREAQRRGLTRPRGAPKRSEGQGVVVAVRAPLGEVEALREQLDAAARKAGFEERAPWALMVLQREAKSLKPRARRK